MDTPLPDPNRRPEAATQPSATLREERDRFVGFAFAAADLLLEVSPEGNIVFGAGAAKALTGVDSAQLIGRSFRSLIAESEREFAAELLHQVRADGRSESVKLSFVGPRAEICSANVSGCLLPEKSNSVYLAIASPRLHGANLSFKGKRDAETGLLDSASFQAAASEALLKAEDVGQSLELALLRLQGLDDLRTRAGSGKLGRLMADIGAFLRAHSIGGNSAGRLAADKFGVLRAHSDANIALGGEIERMSRSYDPQGTGIKAGETSVELDQTGITSNDAAKAFAFILGRFATARAEDFSIASLAEGFRSQISETVNRISRLKAATGTSKITVAFQPIVALGTNLLHHLEMLARFERNKSPYELIQFAEKVGMIEEIDLTMCQRAITTLLELDGPPLDLAVNISGRSLDSDIFVEAMMKLLEPHARLSKQILFEITESTAMSDLQRVDRILVSLRKAGYRICLDDFGAGASSFPYLQALTIDFAKIDGGYVARLRDSAKDRAIVKAMVGMCNDLGVGVIAEMVERVDQAEDLLEMGIGYGQGYLFGRPSPSLAAYVPALGNATSQKKASGVAGRGRAK